MFNRIADYLVRHRDRLPAWCTRLFTYLARNPQSPAGRIVTKLLGGGKATNTEVPDTPVRVYIGSANYAAQGYKWARALEAADGRVGARNSEILLPGGFNFPADNRVPFAAVNGSPEWGAAEFQAVSAFTHVLVEAARPLFGAYLGQDLRAELAALRERGVRPALMCHGTEVRSPARHAELTAWSPYPSDPRTRELQHDADANTKLIAELELPVFVSTPDLLLDVPQAVWCPVVVDAKMFATNAPVRTDPQQPVRIVHSASIPVQKGSDLIAPALERLTAEGLAEYRLITGTPWGEMPAAYADADIVLDQFRLGSYGVAACEAMAAGRVVVGHVLPQVRERVLTDHGLPLPIVEAVPDTIETVLRELISDRQRLTQLAAAGPEFVTRVHSGAASAAVLKANWLAG